MERTHDQLDRYAIADAKRNQRLHPPRLAKSGIARRNCVARLAKPQDGGVQCLFGAYFDGDCLFRHVALIQNQGMITVVGTKHRGTVCAFDRLEPDDARGKIGRFAQIGNAEADIAKLFNRNHRPLFVVVSTAHKPQVGQILTQMFLSAV